MAAKMRLMRMGKKKQPYYRIVIVEDDAPRESRYVDKIGTYNPIKENELSIDEGKALKWLGYGVQPTGTVKNLLSKCGILKKFDESKKNKAKTE